MEKNKSIKVIISGQLLDRVRQEANKIGHGEAELKYFIRLSLAKYFNLDINNRSVRNEIE